MTTYQRRVTDGPKQGKWWVFWRRAYRVWTAIVPAIAVIAAAVAVSNSQEAVKANEEAIELINTEGIDRRDQTCRAFERDTLASVTQFEDAKDRLRRTRFYLARLTGPELPERLNQEIARSIPRMVTDMRQKQLEAALSAAPAYCDEEGVGLPEPNPELPDRPKAILEQ